jgi:hypothetical protein
MICYMHQGNPYGHLKVGDKVILPENLARMVGETLEAVRGWLDELKLAGVYDVAEDGSISSRRMIRDENLRQVRALGGKLGGNPALKKVDKVNLEDNQEVVGEVKEKPTPSSSSSSSNKFVQVDKPEGVTDETWQAFILVRRAKKAPITKLSMAGIEREALAKGRTVPDAIRIVCERGWTTYKAEWDKQEFGSSLDDQFAGAL